MCNVMGAFPGMTPAAMWELPFVEWVIIATQAERWAEEQKRIMSEMRRRR